MYVVAFDAENEWTGKKSIFIVFDTACADFSNDIDCKLLWNWRPYVLRGHIYVYLLLHYNWITMEKRVQSNLKYVNFILTLILYSY